jgi:hypothetical protein
VIELEADARAREHEWDSARTQLQTELTAAEAQLEQLKAELAEKDSVLAGVQLRVVALENEAHAAATAATASDSQREEIERRDDEIAQLKQLVASLMATKAENGENGDKKKGDLGRSNGGDDDGDGGELKAKVKDLLRKVRDGMRIERVVYGNVELKGDESGASDDDAEAEAEDKLGKKGKKGKGPDMRKRAEQLMDFLLERAAFESDADGLLRHVASSLRSAINVCPPHTPHTPHTTFSFRLWRVRHNSWARRIWCSSAAGFPSVRTCCT